MTSHASVTILLMPWGRVGSNLVNSIVAQVPGVVVHNEPLTGIDTKGRQKGASEKETAKWQRVWLQENVVEAKDDQPTFVNLSAVHILDPKSFANVMAPARPVYLILDRLDVAATVVSAMRTNAWVSEGAEKGEKRSWTIPKDSSVDFRPSLEPRAFEQMVELVGKGRTIIDEITQGHDVTRYFYEDLLNDMDGVMTDIFAKARLPYTRYEIRSAKFGSKALSDMIANADEISAVIHQKEVMTELLLPL